MNTPLRVLLVEDSAQDAQLLERELQRGGYTPRCLRVEEEVQFRAALKESAWEVVIADYQLPAFSGLEALKILKESGTDVPFILVSGRMGEQVAVQGMKAGAHDYILKDHLHRLVPALERELREATERRQRRTAEAALREAEQRQKLHVQQTPLAVIEWNLDFEVVAWNPAAERIFGYPAREALGQHASFIVPPHARAHVDEVWRALTLMSGGQRSTNQNLAKDGRIIECEWYNTPLIDDHGRAIGVASLVQDVTERKQAEAEKGRLEAMLRQAQRMEAIGTLAGGIAHDFNNILAAIIPYAHLAKADAGDNAAVQESLEEVLRAAERAKKLVQQILMFSRQQKQERRALDPAPVVKEALKLMRSAIPSHIGIEADIEPSLPPVLADPTQLHQVLMNLCTNAAHAMQPSGGTLTVRLAAVTLESGPLIEAAELRPGRYLELIVRDTGHGMPPDIRQRIFDPFFTTKGSGEGTGLGLSVVHGIVRDHEGVIQVESEPGHGTTFRLLFPAYCGEGEVEPHDGRATPVGNGERILFVDDEQVLCDVVSRLLRRQGYQVVTQTDPAKALARFQSDPDSCDLLFTDLTMPGMSGIDLALQAMKIRPGLPVVLATGYGGAWSPEAVRRLGIREVVSKPIDLSSFAAVVWQALHPDRAGGSEKGTG